MNKTYFKKKAEVCALYENIISFKRISPPIIDNMKTNFAHFSKISSNNCRLTNYCTTRNTTYQTIKER